MNLTTRLKLNGIAFTFLWTGGMLWWSGSLDPVNVIIMTICGSGVGYAWYRVVRWQLARGRLPSRRGPRD